MVLRALLSKTTLLPLIDGGAVPVFGIGVSTLLPLKDGGAVPVIGTKSNGETEQSCLWALENGYRMIDTAAIYRNEEVGQALKKCGVPRDQVYITTKLWNADHGREKTKEALQLTLKKLGVDYVDLYLMHSPVGGNTVETWQTMVELQKQGLAKSVGVSNFNVHHLKNLIAAVPDSVPAVNQVELTPYLTHDNLTSFCKDSGIVIETYSPLTKGEKLNDPKLVAMAKKYGKSTAQILIRWCLQRGFVCIPKSVKKERIKENGDVFDFEISAEDMSTMNGWNENMITGWDVINSQWIP